ncbi:MAG TPA: tetratricopeptide repeat protein [Candidatus Binataceae bacterium]|nr:tetratricopeptide repeat protein [Candidatus Binataceae bacterium]
MIGQANLSDKTAATINNDHPAFSGIGGDSDPSLWLAATLVVTAIALSRSLYNQFVFDDYPEIIYNRYLGDWSFIWKSFAADGWWFVDPNHLPQSSYYRPLLDVWLWVNYQLFGLHPAGWHAAMVVLHLVVVWLAYRVASRLARNRWTGLLAATLFALMPIHAQAVIWPAAISYPLSAAFELAAFEFYLRGRAHSGANGPQPRELAISLGLFGGALLTYEGAVTFPVLIAAHAYLLGSSPVEGAVSTAAGRFRTAFTATVPYAVELIGYFLLRFYVLGFIARPYLENHMTPIEVMLTIPGVIASYAMMLAMPWLAGPTHQMDTVSSAANSGFYLPILGLTGICVAAFLLFRRHPHRQLYLFCTAWIVIALGPMFNIGQLQDQLAVQDRYLYLASFGFCVFVADIVFTTATTRTAATTVIAIVSGVAIVLYAALLFSIQSYWHDEVSLFSQCVAIAPKVGAWHSRLGLALEAQGNFGGARHELEKAIYLDPYTGGNVFYDLGLVDERLGDPHAAAQMMAEGLKRYDHPPLIAYTDAAIAADAAGDPQTAESELKRAEAIPGGGRAAALARAQIRFLHKDNKGAEASLRDLLNREPDYVPALNVLGAVLSADHRDDAAILAYRHALKTAPHDAGIHYRIALSLHKLGRDREARDECAIALVAAPNDRNIERLMDILNRSIPAS